MLCGKNENNCLARVRSRVDGETEGRGVEGLLSDESVAIPSLICSVDWAVGEGGSSGSSEMEINWKGLC